VHLYNSRKCSYSLNDHNDNDDNDDNDNDNVNKDFISKQKMYISKLN